MDYKKYTSKANYYRFKVSSRYQSVSKENIDSKLPHADGYVIMTKYDGHFFVMAIEDGKAAFFNPRGKIVDDLPIMAHIPAAFTKKNIVVAGELFVKGDGRTHSFDLTKALTAKSESIHFAAFDLLEVDGEPYEFVDTLQTRADLKELCPGNEFVYVAAGMATEDRSEIKTYYEQIVEEQGLEGIIVKPKTGGTFKLKPKFSLDAVIVGFAEGDGDRKGLLRDFLLAFIKEDGSYQVFAHMSHGLSEADRARLLIEYQKKVVPSDYIAVARNKVAFQMVEPDTVVEFTCMDIISEDASGPIMKMNMSYDGKEYHANRLMPGVSVSIPVFVRFRDDKKADALDARFSQLDDYVEISESSNVDLAESEMLQREVYIKESRGNKMVRKFITFKTNKEDSKEFPAYVFHYTDFSAGRKDPLKTDIKVSNSAEQIQAIYDKSIASNIKKGWVKVEMG